MNEVTIHSPANFAMSDMMQMATAIAKGGLFGSKDPNAVLTLCLMAQADGMHPVRAMLDYDIIQGRPTKKAEAMLRDLIRSGGKVEWHTLDDTTADATFSHPQGGSVRIAWDMKRAAVAGLGSKDMWKKFPRQMLRSRVVSEGVRTVAPGATSGLYVPEEVADFEPMRDVTPARAEPVAAPAASLTDDEQLPMISNPELVAYFTEQFALAESQDQLVGVWKQVAKRRGELNGADFATVTAAKDHRKADLAAAAE